MQTLRSRSNRRRWLTAIALLAALLAVGMLEPKPRAFAATQSIPIESLLNPDGSLNIAAGTSGTLDLRGWNVALDSVRGPVLTRRGPVAIPRAGVGTWSALAHDGLSDRVSALALTASGDLYVGGSFTETDDAAITGLNYIAKYSHGAWSALAHEGLNAQVWALAVSGDDLYVGGAGFFATGDGLVTGLHGICKYSGGAWSPLTHGGLDGTVTALAVSGSDLYVGGDFTQTFDLAVKQLNHIAKYTDGTWTALAHQGLNDIVRTIAVSGSDLYVGGDFTGTSDGGMTSLSHIAKYGGGNWMPLAHNGLKAPAGGDYVRAIVVMGSDVYVGGSFTRTADELVTNLNNIAKYSGGEWSSLAYTGLNGGVWALAVNGNNLFVGGEFTQTVGGAVTGLNHVAMYSNGAWSGFAHNGLDATVYTIAIEGKGLYAGGDFGYTADYEISTLNHIAELELASAHLYLPLILCPAP